MCTAVLVSLRHMQKVVVLSVAGNSVCCQQLDTVPCSMLMCLQEVAVSVVGKYRYQMYSPAEHRHLPVIVDIILVGR